LCLALSCGLRYCHASELAGSAEELRYLMVVVLLAEIVMQGSNGEELDREAPYRRCLVGEGLSNTRSYW